MAGIITGNVQSIASVSIALTPAIVAANTTAEQTFTVPGVLLSDVCIDVTKPSTQAGLGIVNSRVSAANTVAITFSNNSASGITPTAGETYRMTIIRLDSTQSSFSV